MGRSLAPLLIAVSVLLVAAPPSTRALPTVVTEPTSPAVGTAAEPTAAPLARSKPGLLASAGPTADRRAVPLGPGPGFVTTCGTSLCLDGDPWQLHGASVFGALDDPHGAVARARAAGLNTIRIVNFLDEDGGDLAAATDEAAWARVDALIAAAAEAELKVILDLSTYRNLVRTAGANPYTHDWSPFIRGVAMRLNQASGVVYRDDPTIAMIAFAGEVEPLNTPDNALGITTAQVTEFFDRAYATWRDADPNHLVTSGGLLHYGWDSGIDWRAVQAGADVCSIHNYSADDSAATPAVADYCLALGKPWIIEEFGWDQSIGDAERAAAFAGIYDLADRHGAAGVAFWNLGGEAGRPTFDVNETTPRTLEIVLARATSLTSNSP